MLQKLPQYSSTPVMADGRNASILQKMEINLNHAYLTMYNYLECATESIL